MSGSSVTVKNFQFVDSQGSANVYIYGSTTFASFESGNFSSFCSYEFYSNVRTSVALDEVTFMPRTTSRNYPLYFRNSLGINITEANVTSIGYRPRSLVYVSSSWLEYINLVSSSFQFDQTWFNRAFFITGSSSRTKVNVTNVAITGRSAYSLA